MCLSAVWMHGARIHHVISRLNHSQPWQIFKDNYLLLALQHGLTYQKPLYEISGSFWLTLITLTF